MSVGRIATRVVATASPSESVLEVARLMTRMNVGTVVVVDGENKPVGIVTDRDIVTRSVSKEMDAADTPVSVVMSRDVRSVDESTPIETALATMANVGARRLTVTGEESRLVGLLSVDDVLQLLTEEAGNIGELLAKEAPRIQA